MPLFYIYFILVFLTSSLYLTDFFNFIGSFAISIAIILIFPLIIILKKYTFKTPRYSLLIMSFLFLTCMISSLANNYDIKLFISGTMIVVLYIAAYIIIPSFDKIRINEMIYKSVMISNLPIIILPLLITGFNTNPYKGIFYNTNSFGSIVATLFTLLLAIFLFKLENYYTKISNKKQTLRNLLVYLLGLFFTFFLIIMSGSRTSVLTTTMLIIIGIFLVFIRLIKNKATTPFIKSIFLNTIGVGVIAVLVRITPFYNYLYHDILYKFQLKIARGDVLDQRGDVWTQTLHEASLFGNGSNYFITKTAIAAHNTFISLLGEYGWILLILFVLFLIYGAYTSLKYALSKIQDKYKYMPILLLACFTMLSAGEIMLFKLSMLLMFFSFGSTLNLKNKISKLDKTEEYKTVENYKTKKKLIL